MMPHHIKAHLAVVALSLAYARLNRSHRCAGSDRLLLAGLFIAALAPILAQDIAAHQHAIKQYALALAKAKATLNQFDA